MNQRINGYNYYNNYPQGYPPGYAPNFQSVYPVNNYTGSSNYPQGYPPNYQHTIYSNPYSNVQSSSGARPCVGCQGRIGFF